MAHITNVFEQPCKDGRKSFYGKAHVYLLDDGTQVLKSYDTFVMSIDPAGTPHRHWGGWSLTTSRHIWSFCGIDTKTYREMAIEDKPRF